MLLHQFKEYIVANNLFQPKDKLLLAVSGGVDSVVLCELCHQAGYDFVMAHCNFQLRGEESERDEAFVRKLAEKYGVKVFVKRFDTDKYAAERKKSIQEAARDLRYKWFLEICTDGTVRGEKLERHDKTGWHATIDFTKQKILIATAHHANDSAETLLMNFFKGTGIKGLQGIKPRHDLLIYLIRPLLFARKEELLAFAKQSNLSYVEDSSNSSDKYTRNYFRNQLLPSIKKVYPDVENNLIDNLTRFSEIEILYQQAIEQHKKKLIEKKGIEFHIPVLKLLKTEPLQTVLYEIIKEFGFTSHQVTDAIALLKSETGKYIQSSTHRIIKNRNWLIIAPNDTAAAQNILIEAGDDEIIFDAGEIKIKRTTVVEHKIKQSTLLAQLDINDIEFPLLLRKWKQGDYFYPLGMNKKKKLSRFFIDQKLSLPQKENTWVVEMNKKIIWIVGMRIDNRFKITAQTQQLLLLELVKKKDA
ncbi:MAG: tRNA lysidine(34) synthetase TilS [Bacteroidota bacterium]